MPLTSQSQLNEQQVLLEITNAFASALEAGTLVRVLVDVLTRTLQTRRIVTYLRTDDRDKYVYVGSTHQKNPKCGTTALFPPLIACARETDEVLVTRVMLNQPEPHDQIGVWMQANEIEAALPMVAGGELYGVVLLGPKRRGGAYQPDEIGLLHLIGKQAAIAFGNARHYAELRWLNTELEQLVDDRTQELAAALAQLQQANRAKDEFLAILSHELLTPLTCILAWSEVADGQQNPEMTVKALEVIQENVRRQRHLIKDLLDTSRIVHGKMELDREPLELWGLVTDCVEAVCHHDITERLQVTVLSPDIPMLVLADRTRMEQVITNLLNNAIKFTAPGGTITIGGYVSTENAIISISDTGHGIPAEYLSSIFTPFAQGPQGRAAGGLGLGLALAHSITTLHGGSVRAESEGEGKGSRFTVTLPLEGI